MGAKLYSLGEPKHPIRKRVLKGLALFVLLAVIGAGIYVYQDIQASRDVNEDRNQPFSTTVINTEEKTKRVDEPDFYLDLPEDWKETERDDQHIRWVSQNEQSRWIDLYLGALPQKAATTRVLPVMVSSNALVAGDVSPRCHVFTDAPKQVSENTIPPPATATWDKVDFLCDFNTVLNTIGTGSTDGSLVTVKGELTEQKYFFVYTDHSAREDVNVFLDILSTFRAK